MRLVNSIQRLVLNRVVLILRFGTLLTAARRAAVPDQRLLHFGIDDGRGSTLRGAVVKRVLFLNFVIVLSFRDSVLIVDLPLVYVFDVGVF